MNSKAKSADDAQQNYLSQVNIYNQNQHVFYEQELPHLLTDLQHADSQHSDQLKEIFREFIRSHSEVLPRIQVCLQEMSKKTEEIDAIADENRLIDEYKSGYTIPEDYQPVKSRKKRAEKNFTSLLDRSERKRTRERRSARLRRMSALEHLEKHAK